MMFRIRGYEIGAEVGQRAAGLLALTCSLEDDKTGCINCWSLQFGIRPQHWIWGYHHNPNAYDCIKLTTIGVGPIFLIAHSYR